MSLKTDALLVRAVRLMEDGAHGRRREDLTERAVRAGHDREYADLLYDVAMEENVDPALAFELVLAGVGVRDLDAQSADRWEEAQVEAPPEWVTQAEAPRRAVRERRARATFRRMRRMVEESATVVEAVQALLREADVGDVVY